MERKPGRAEKEVGGGCCLWSDQSCELYSRCLNNIKVAFQLTTSTWN